MRKMSRQFLSVLLAAVMILSHVQISAAAGNDTASGSPAAASGSEAEGTQNLEMEPMDPAKLGIKKLGEETEEAGDEGDDGEISLTPDTSLNKTVRVSIFLDGKSTVDAGFDTKGIASNQSAVSYRNALKAQQAKMTARIESVLGHTLDVKWNLTLLANAISVNVKVKEIPLIERLEGVVSVEREMHYEAPVTEGDAEPQTANTSENMVMAQAAWVAGYTGAGSRIAIIDTGIDTSHQSFADEPFTYAINAVGASSELMTVNDISSVLSQLNAKEKMSSVTANQLNGNGRKKIVYGFNYVDGNTTIDHNSDTQGNHGSHVAGIAAANRYIGSAHNDAIDAVGAVGMAPNAQLLIMKVFGSSGGAYDSDYFVALEDAIVLGCDSANLSLGSAAPGWTFDSTYQDILNNLVNKEHNDGMVVSISAGNSYAFADFTDSRNIYKDDVHYHTGGSPGTFVNSLGVASADNTLTKGMPLVFNGSQKVFYAESTGDSDGNTYTNPAINTIAGSYNFVYIDAVGNPADFSAVNAKVSLSGKIVIVNRGELSFSEKGNNAKSYSPKGMVVANNEDGTINMNLADFTGDFPMVSITLKDANQIKANSTANTAGSITYYTGSVQVTNVEEEMLTERSEAVISDFSSWGVPGSLLMKPEITAPGGNIYSVYGASKGDNVTAHDQYESFSGTSMAAPHITGLAAVVAEYLRENPVANRNSELASNYTTREIIQSLLMSTATPMKPEGEYLSILQQGSGLADVNAAVNAPSVIMMTDEGNTLTVRTGANEDGKVKAELGDDPKKTGSYSFGFTIYNLSDQSLTYELDTKLFTQKISGEFLGKGTSNLPSGGVSYVWNGVVSAANHDVDKDGDTDDGDAQAILDYLTGVKEEADVDLSVADLDEDGEITTRDAYLLLNDAPEAPAEGYVVAPHSTATVIVTINLTAEQRSFLEQYENGAYLEGFTSVSCSGATREGVSLTHTHTIPILGFYGSWTDPSMFDNMSYVDELYGAERLPYSGTSDTNYLQIVQNGTIAKFSGNPYTVEDEFPTKRLAINGNTTMDRIVYNLIRSAGTTGFAVTRLDTDGNVTEILSSAVTGNNVDGQYYHVNQGTWMNTMTKFQSIDKTAAFYGLNEGDRFRVGFYAVPEYYGMVLNDSFNEADSGLLELSGFNTLLTDNMLGKGAFVGYDLVVDNTDPEITNASINGNTLSITASDDRALAYVAVLSMDGSKQYAEAAPGSDTYTVSFDASNAIANAQGYVAAFVGDYAGNEAAVAIKVNDNTHVKKTVYVLTNSVSAGEDYLILNTNAAGNAYALYYTLNSSQSTATAGAAATPVQAGTADTNGQPFVESADAASTGIWTAGSGSSSGTYTFSNNGWYLRRSNTNGLTITKDTTRRDWTWNGTNNRLSINSRYLRYYNNTFSLNTSTNSVYLYVKTTISYEIDPYSVASVTVTPNTLELYKGDTANLTAKVAPLTATDRSVTWSSVNPSIATVSDLGVVTAVSVGTTTIRATSNADSTKFAECEITVVAINKELSAAIWDEEGEVYFSYFNANNLPNWTKRHNTGTGVYVTSAMMASTSALYACTNDLSTSLMYTVNRSSYAMTETGECYVPSFGLATVGTSFGGTSYFVTAFAKYIMFGNLQPKTEDEIGTYIGFPYGLLDLTETDVGDAYAVAICCRNKSTTSAGYYFLDENGKIWQTNQSYSQSSGISFSAPTLVYDTGINAGLTYNSIYYDGTNLYWTHQDGNVALLYILANANTAASRKFYRAGNFGEGVWPAAGLYVNGSLAPASVGGDSEIMEAGDETFDASTLKIQATRDELFTADIQARFAAEAERMAAKKVNAPAEVPAEPAPVEEVTETESVETPAETESPEAPAEETEAPVETEAEPEETETEPAETEEPIEESETDSEETEATEEVTEAPAEEPAEATEAEAEESSEEESLDPEYTGSLNVARVVSASKEQVSDASGPQAAPTSGMAADGTFTLSIDEEDANNGLYAITFDPEEVEYIDYTTELDYFSINPDVDEQAGKIVITVAFAAESAVDEIAQIYFRAKSWESASVEVITLENNEDVALNVNEEVDLVPTFRTHSLVLSGQIGVNFFMNLPEIEGVDYTNSYVEFTISGKNGETTVAYFDENSMNSSRTYYKFTCYTNAIQMAETITAVFHYGDKQTVPNTYSIKQYINDFEEKVEANPAIFDERVIAAVHAMADFGHYVQPYLAENRDWEIGVDYAEMNKYYTETYDFDEISAAVSGYAISREHSDRDIEKITYSLSLDSGTDVFVYYKPTAGYNGNFIVTLDGTTVTAENTAGRYKVTIPKISAHKLGDVHTIVVQTDNGNATVVVSALSYVQTILETSTDPKAMNAVASVYNYYKTVYDVNK